VLCIVGELFVNIFHFKTYLTILRREKTMKYSSLNWLVLAALVSIAGMAQAVTIDLVPVGDINNAADATTGYGSVDHAYAIGKYEVTAGQYCEFLNATAKNDLYELYNVNMGYSDELHRGCNIQRSGSVGSYIYSVAPDYVNRPVNYVSFWDACRFVNWLQNGQGNGSTETGAYTLNGYNSVNGDSITRNTDANWFVPSEDEWYKAAYYKGGSTNAGYWVYPTKSDTFPGHDMADANGNNANFYEFGSTWPSDPPYYTTLVGEFQNSAGPYGTFDQGGNVWEWNQSVLGQWQGVSLRGRRGGSFGGFTGYASGDMAAFSRNGDYVLQEYDDIGFRVASVPEPGSIVLLLTATIGGLLWWRRRA
jgi:formylglycine-generating enzyme